MLSQVLTWLSPIKKTNGLVINSDTESNMASREEEKETAKVSSKGPKTDAKSKSDSTRVYALRSRFICREKILLSKPPSGEPMILNWNIERDGGISGTIYGSKDNEDGDDVITSPIKMGDAVDGALVTTETGAV